jgi:protoporphyrinogen oxidase
MKIGIVGAGATGLTAGYELVKQGHEVVILERNSELGGLAASLTIGGTAIERYYHHIFASDLYIIALIEELGLKDKLQFQAPKTGIYYGGKVYDFSTPADMLRFPPIGLASRIRFGVSSAYLKATKDYHKLENINALQWTARYAGKEATKVIWEPLLRGKFGDRADDISMAWLWARIHSRTFQLGYLLGGFDQIYTELAKRITQKGTITFSVNIQGISQQDSKSPVKVTLEDGTTQSFDKLIVTIPQPIFAKMIHAKDTDVLWENRYLGATCFILELKKSFMPYYWLNINDSSFPFLALVEHTNLIDKKLYGGNHLLYIGNYVGRDDWRFTSTPEELLEKYLPYLKRVNPEFRTQDIVQYHFSKAPYAQPIVTPQYKQFIPGHDTTLPGVKLATMSQVYPQDRGQNYAIQMGIDIAQTLL